MQQLVLVLHSVEMVYVRTLLIHKNVFFFLFFLVFLVDMISDTSRPARFSFSIFVANNGRKVAVAACAVAITDVRRRVKRKGEKKPCAACCQPKRMKGVGFEGSPHTTNPSSAGYLFGVRGRKVRLRRMRVTAAVKARSPVAFW